MAKAPFASMLTWSLLSTMSVLMVALPSTALADAGYSASSTPVITPSSSSQVIQPPAGSTSPNSGLPSPSPSSGSSSSNSDAPKTTGLDANPIKPRPDVQARPTFKDRL